jgi:hypothetical protein
VELDQESLAWRISSYCSNAGCVEIASTPRAVLVRDSTDPQSPVLSFSTASWSAFLDGIRAGDFRVDDD